MLSPYTPRFVDIPTLIAVTVILILGSTLQGAAGFGFGMFAIPLLILLGCKPFEAIVFASIGAGVQSTIGVWVLRRHVRWAQCLAMIVLAAGTIPVGILVLERIDGLEPSRVRQIFGAIILAALLVQLLARIEPRERLHPAWMLLAMPCSGFMSGLAGMGGPPAVLWVMAHRWSGERSRATLWVLFAALTPLQVVFLYRRFGDGVLDAARIGAILAPLTLLGVGAGLWIGGRIPKRRLRHLSYVILFLVSMYAILQPMWAG